MSTWKVRVEAHPVWDSLSSVREAASSGGWADDLEWRDALARITWVCDQVIARKEPNAITDSSLDQVNSVLTNMLNQLTQWKEQKAGDANWAHQQIDALLALIAAWPSPSATRATQSSREAAATFQMQAEEAIGDLRLQNEELKSQTDLSLAAWQSAADEKQVHLEEKNAELGQTADAVSSELAAQKQRLDAALDANNQNFQEAEKERHKAATEVAAKVQKAAEGQLAGQSQAGSTRIAELDEMLAQAKNTLEALGSVTTATHYASYAQDQKKSANLWNAITLGTLALSAACLAWALVEAKADTWHFSVLRAGLGFIFLTAAGYGGKQASGHRAEERKAKRFELGISALDPFLANVPPDDAKAVRTRIAAQLFTDELSSRSAPADDEVSTVIDLVAGIVTKLAASSRSSN